MQKLTYFNRSNLDYIEQQYQQFLSAPESVDPSLHLFFEGIECADQFAGKDTLSIKELKVYQLINTYRDYGHTKAQLDPLNVAPADAKRFELSAFDLTPEDLEKRFAVGEMIGLKNEPLKKIIEKLEALYCHTLSMQVANCEAEVRDWFHNELQADCPQLNWTDEKRRSVLYSLNRADTLERFLHTRFVGAKRFSVEGADALMPILDHALEWGIELGVREVILGMAHRGRINVLANFLNQDLSQFFVRFAETNNTEDMAYDGDVKYHLGHFIDKKTKHGECHVSLAFNPSHLEFVGPVVCGMTRAKQRSRNDEKQRQQVIPIITHGDAAFAGQGVTSETFQLSQLDGYTVGGTIHIIINNQLGFTTNPKDGRSTRYSSDVANAVKAPVILVNGDDVEACVKAMHLAMKFRQTFKQDVVIDLICYRRYGHNESDEPAFTQPLMYEKIKKHPRLQEIYSAQLIQQGTITETEHKEYIENHTQGLQNALEEVKKNPPPVEVNTFGGLWSALVPGTAEEFKKPADTAASKAQLSEVITALTTKPQNFNLNKKVAKLLENRKNMWTADQIDWGLAELLAYGSLKAEGISTRISGQDCKRGTFSHRHAVYFDAQTGEEFCPLTTINPKVGEFCVYNSLLSEMAVLGFEYGNSISDPHFLTVWEAQFGDFANCAQVIIDQFLSSGEQKWARYTGLTLLLPHGYEGQGPEHSSARLERFLQLCAQNNMQVCNLTTPANLFHALRRQVKRNFRRPLIVMSPKSLLRHPEVISPVSDFTKGQFKEVIEDHEVTPKQVDTLVICTGKLYYDLNKARKENKKNNVALLRLEQIYPFPDTALAPHLNGYPNLKRLVWAQEEPQNMGAYFFVKDQLQSLLQSLGIAKITVEYAGRTERASPATGYAKVHAKEQDALVAQALKL